MKEPWYVRRLRRTVKAMRDLGIRRLGKVELWSDVAPEPQASTPTFTGKVEQGDLMEANRQAAMPQQQNAFQRAEEFDTRCACGHLAEIEHCESGCLMGCDVQTCMKEV